MAFVWPDGVQNKTKRTISQILWTLHLDFDGAIRDSKDAPKDLMQAMEGHGVELKNDMWFRMILPHLDGGKYGKLITRVVIQRRTKEIRLAVKTLPEDSHLPDGAGGIGTDTRLDMQLFGDIAWTPPARGATRDESEVVNLAREEPRDVVMSGTDSARGDIRDMDTEPARGPARDMDPAANSARGDTRDTPAELVRETARDDYSSSPARGDTRDLTVMEPAGGLAPDEAAVPDELGLAILRLDSELDELAAPLPPDGELDAQDLLNAVIGIMANFESLVQSAPAVESGRSEAEWDALLTEKHGLLEQLGRYMRRIKDAEARLVDRGKEVQSAQLQLAALSTRYERLEANNRALMEGERAGGQHLRTVEKFISETPSDRPERGRSRPTRPNGRTTGSESKLAYTVG